MKRKFGETLKSKNPVAQVNELLAKMVQSLSERNPYIPTIDVYYSWQRSTISFLSLLFSRRLLPPSYEPEVSGNLKIKAQIWSSVPMVRAWVSIDKGERRKMNLTWQGLWYEAQTSIDIQNLPRGYHTAKITAIDDKSVFSKSFSFKVTEDAFTPIGDLLSHPQTYLGKHPRIEGYLDYIETNLSNLELGDLPVFCDDTGKIPFALEYCPPLPQQENKTKWTATGQFQNYKNNTFSVFLLQRDDTCPEKVS